MIPHPRSQLDWPLSRPGRALQDLNASDQQLLLLVVRERLDRDQLAMLLGVSSSTISGRVHRARVRLAQALAAHEITASDHPLRQGTRGQTGLVHRSAHGG